MCAVTDALTYIKTSTGFNYPLWKVRIPALLVTKGFWKQVDSTVDDDDSTDKQKIEKALALIILALRWNQIVHTEKCKNAQNVRKKLTSIYPEPGTANQIRFSERLFTLRVQHTEEAHQHLQEPTRTRTQLRGVGVDMVDVLYKLARLRS